MQFAASEYTVQESDREVTIAVVLSEAAEQDVTVDYEALDGLARSASDYEATAGTLTFAAGETRTTFNVPIIFDTVQENDETFLVLLQNPAPTGIASLGLPVQTTVNILNSPKNEPVEPTEEPEPEPEPSGSVTIDPDRLALTEGEASSSYSVVLDSQPTADVVISITADDSQLSVSPSSLTFATDNWDVPQTVSVSAREDGETEGTHATSITHSASSDDRNYDGITVDAVQVTISEVAPAPAGITLSKTTLSVGEDGTNDSYTLVLESKPAAAVTIDLVAPDSQITLSPASITFQPTTWNQAQRITVQAVDDQIAEGTHSSTILHSVSSSDSAYNGFDLADVTATIADNDTAGVSIKPTSLRATEGGDSAYYQVLLTSQPRDNVSILIVSDAQLSVTPQMLTFTPANWNRAQLVTVNAVNEGVKEGLHQTTISHQAASDDATYQGIGIAKVAVLITDAPDCYASYPDFCIPPSNTDLTCADVDGQNFTVLHNVANPDPHGFDPDKDGIGCETDPYIQVDPYNLDVTEGGNAVTYTLVLSRVTSADVTVTIGMTPDDQVEVAPASVTFSPDNWNIPQVLTVTAVDDLRAEGTHKVVLTHSVTSQDNSYGAASFSVDDANVTIRDNETPGVTIEPESLTISEPSGSAPFVVTLDSLPAEPVTLTLTVSDTSECNISASAASITLDASNWQDGVTVAVNAEDDEIADGGQTCTIQTSQTSSTDASYDGLDVDDLPVVTVQDDDQDKVGISISPLSQRIISEPDETDKFKMTVELGTRPLDDVTLTLTSNDETEATVSPATITVKPEEWKSKVFDVTVTAVDDDIVDGTQEVTIETTLASSDANYDGTNLNPDDVSVTVEDDDTAGFEFNPNPVTVSEPDESEDVTISLTSKPEDEVTLNLSTSNDECSVSPDKITLDDTNWQDGLPVTVSAENDDVADGDKNCIISADPSSSSDAVYKVVADGKLTANVKDDDSKAINTSTDTLTFAEEGDTGTYDVWLNSQPIGDVTVNVKVTDGQTLVSKDSGSSFASEVNLPFTPTNWDTPQTVTVQAVQDDGEETDPQDGEITHTAFNANYDGVSKNVAVTINQDANDPPVLTVPDDQTVDEDTTLLFSGDVITIADPDAGAHDVQLSIRFTNGTITLNTTNLTIIKNVSGEMVVQGTINDINDALDTLAYTGNKDFNGNAKLNLEVNDLGNSGGLSITEKKDSAIINVEIIAVNDPPSITLPVAQNAVVNTDLSISGISIADPDEGGADVEVTLTAVHGTLTLNTTAGLTSVSGDGSKTVTLQGPLTSINTALEPLTYRSDTDYVGSDTITVDVDDLSNTGAGGSRTDTEVLDVEVYYWFDDMESGVNGWTTTSSVSTISPPPFFPVTSSWQQFTTTDSCGGSQTHIAHSDSTSWWYGDNTDCNYGTTGAIEYGELRTPIINIPASATAPKLRYWQWYELDSDNAGDWIYVNIDDVNTASTPDEIQVSGTVKSSPDSSGGWEQVEVDISAYRGKDIQIIFYFYADGVSDNDNDNRGWYVDDVGIGE